MEICEQLDNILKPHIRASKIKLSYVDELFPDLKDKEYIVLHKNVSDNSKYFKCFSCTNLLHVLYKCTHKCK